MNDDTVIHVRDLRVCYGAAQVASLPSLVLNRGECAAVVGESGSGKTTSLLAVLGLLRGTNAVVTGSVRACGLDVLASSARQLAEIRGARIALIMQSPQGALNPTMRLGTLMRRALRRHGVSRAEIPARVRDAFASVLLAPEIQRRYPHEVSGGQAQRLAIAMAVALGADVIAADEPTSALDVTVQTEIMATLLRLRVERGMALLIVSHDLALVSTIADQVIVMRDGNVVEQGPMDQVLHAPQCRYTRELIAAVPTLEPRS